jgi:tetratricopeptide (TPR) repeat protein
LVLLLDDIQWADRPSLAIVDHLLGAMAYEPFLVVAHGRRDTSGLLATLWDSHYPQHVRLAPLTRGAASRLVTDLMRAQAAPESEELVAFAVGRGSGNPLHLEELVRHAVTHGPASAPTAVLSMLVARFEQLDPDARLTLRAASILGQTFDVDGIHALVGGVAADAPTRLWLEQLALLNVIDPKSDTNTACQRYVFRHDLLREAAYSLLTEADRANGHRLAGEWLANRGGAEPLVVAEHYLQSDAPEHALPWLLRAAQRAMGGGNLESVIEVASRGLALKPAAESRAALHAIRAEAHALQGDWPAACAEAALGFSAARPGTPDWWTTAGLELFGGTGLTSPERVIELVAALAGVETVEQPDARYARAMHCAIAGLLLAGQRGSAEVLVGRVRNAAVGRTSDASFEGWLCASDTVAELYRSHPNLGDAWRRAEQTFDLFTFSGDRMGLAIAWWYRSWVRIELGLYAESVECARRALVIATDARSPFVVEWARYMEASALLSVNPLEGEHRARMLARDTRDEVRRAFTRVRLALHLADEGRMEEAEAEANAVLSSGSLVPIVESPAFVVLAQAALCKGEARAALDFARRALRAADSGADPIWLSHAHLVYTEALSANHFDDDAMRALKQATAYISEIAEHLAGTPQWHSAYLTMPVHVRVHNLAHRADAVTAGHATSVLSEGS